MVCVDARRAYQRPARHLHLQRVWPQERRGGALHCSALRRRRSADLPRRPECAARRPPPEHPRACFVQFVEMPEAMGDQAVQLLNHRHLGSRYIEVFLSSESEASQAQTAPNAQQGASGSTWAEGNGAPASNVRRHSPPRLRGRAAPRLAGRLAGRLAARRARLLRHLAADALGAPRLRRASCACAACPST